MRIKLFLLISLLLAHTTYFTTKTETYWYTDKYCLCLIKDGINSFINLVKNKPEEIYIKALHDVNSVSLANHINMPKLLNNLCNNLHYRIDRIEKLVGKDTESSAIVLGCGLTTAGVILGYIIKTLYKKNSLENQKQIDSIIQLFENQDIHIQYNASHKKIVFDKPIYGFENFNQADKLAKLHDSKANIKELTFLGGFISFLALLGGALQIHQGLNPHYDDKYYEKYKTLLTITKRFMQNYKIS